MRARDIREDRRQERRRDLAARDAAGRNHPVLRHWRRLRRGLSDLVLRTLGPTLVRLLAWTWRIQRRGEPGFAVLRGDQAWVLMLWHGRLLVPLPLRHHAHRQIGVLVSPSDDGKLAGIALRRFGCLVIRGSASRGGASALREMDQALASGTPVVITPDGPRGPRHATNSGAAWLARSQQVPLLSLAVACDRAWRLRSWDRFVIPKPFAKIVLTYGDPRWVAEATDDLALENIAREVGDDILAAERSGFAALGVPHDHGEA